MLWIEKKVEIKRNDRQKLHFPSHFFQLHTSLMFEKNICFDLRLWFRYSKIMAIIRSLSARLFLLIFSSYSSAASTHCIYFFFIANNAFAYHYETVLQIDSSTFLHPPFIACRPSKMNVVCSCRRLQWTETFPHTKDTIECTNGKKLR